MHTVTLQPSGHTFQVEEGETLLTAALRQGFVLPYGCRNGACGSCKGRLIAGELDYGSYQLKALTDLEKSQGKVLFCQAKPLSDVTLEARTVGTAKDIPVRTLPCRVAASGDSHSPTQTTSASGNSAGSRPRNTTSPL